MLTKYVIGVDPSGEVTGTTGIVVLETTPGKLSVVNKASVYGEDSTSLLDYWDQVLIKINKLYQDYEEDARVAVSLEDYVLYKQSAKAQINSEMLTSKLIGAITMWCYHREIPLYKRRAVDVMKRWTDNILVHHKLIKQKNNKWVTDNELELPLMIHERDALRHACHCALFELGKDKKCITSK